MNFSPLRTSTSLSDVRRILTNKATTFSSQRLEFLAFLCWSFCPKSIDSGSETDAVAGVQHVGSWQSFISASPFQSKFLMWAEVSCRVGNEAPVNIRGETSVPAQEFEVVSINSHSNIGFELWKVMGGKWGPTCYWQVLSDRVKALHILFKDSLSNSVLH